ncbi:PepSY domain-containing protein [Methylosinus sp. Sm6]|uniref:PepSY-associated TM helix domain-containing protein n=1 Tax=Methylosinus sp. Sm6 TaxID=2866948 RepID=UPI001C99BDAE|nr:PepSY-associated TM helix domain-containing protein [Methylosinus sp. Sm6]MBY6243606.1 PepSY domain-containing protein [Methylosinus sp. Sm6]
MNVIAGDEARSAAASPTGGASAPRRGRARKIWTAYHRWVGVVAGAYLVIAGLTGSVLAFWQDLDIWLNADIMRVAEPFPNAPRRSPSDIIAAARASMAADAEATNAQIFVSFPRRADAAARIDYFLGLPSDEPPSDRASGASEPPEKTPSLDLSKIEGHSIFVDPYSAKVTGRRDQGKITDPLGFPFIYMVMSLHCALLWEPYGRLAVAAIGLLLLISVIDGLALWWPRRGNWRKALTFKQNAGAERFVYDLHKTVGVYLGAVLVVSIFSGVYMNFKAPWRALVSLASPVREMPMDLKSGEARGRAAIDVDAALRIVDQIFPDGRLQTILPPRGPHGAYLIGKRTDDEVNQASTSRMVAIDQYSGDVLASQDPRLFSAGEKFFEWMYPLHSGEAFGDPGRAFILLFGIVPVTLYATGFIRWLQKRRAARRAAAR